MLIIGQSWILLDVWPIIKSAFYPCANVVIICGKDLQRLILVLLVHCHLAHFSDDAFIQRLLKPWTVETLFQNAEGDSSGGKLVSVPFLSSLWEKKHNEWKIWKKITTTLRWFELAVQFHWTKTFHTKHTDFFQFMTNFKLNILCCFYLMREHCGLNVVSKYYMLECNQKIHLKLISVFWIQSVITVSCVINAPNNYSSS